MWSKLMNTPVLHAVSCRYPKKTFVLQRTALRNISWGFLIWTDTFPQPFLQNKILITTVLEYANLILHPLLAHVCTLGLTGDAVSQAWCKLAELGIGIEDSNRGRRWICRSRESSSWLLNSDLLKSITRGLHKVSRFACTKDKWRITGSDIGQSQQCWAWRAQGWKNIRHKELFQH